MTIFIILSLSTIAIQWHTAIIGQDHTLAILQVVLHRAGPGSKPGARAGLEEAQGSGNPEPDPQVRAGPGRARPRAKARASCGQYIE